MEPQRSEDEEKAIDTLGNLDISQIEDDLGDQSEIDLIEVPLTVCLVDDAYIAAAGSVELGYEAVAAETSGIEKRREYWRWALIAMLGLLAAEWWIYTKRVA